MDSVIDFSDQQHNRPPCYLALAALSLTNGSMVNGCVALKMSSVIEEVIQELPGVAEVAVVAHPSSKHYDIPMAFDAKAPGMVVSTSDIHEIVKNKLPSAMRLSGVRFLEKLSFNN
ncbi:hypothetical protein MSG28_009378 [Choristoneura fumiferana]|uniref:Uncharacterized protein n=1 Tax=Choristoneura fumiferana TaxID=7141 RepID=A0ACC0KY65_CHOFU|nr:hypothetical protein MSG28_009378 [Choristoneura fumiferana]